MKFKAVSGIILTLLLVGMLIWTFNIQPAKADYTWAETIYIRADGSVEPDAAPVSTLDNITYMLTDNVFADMGAHALPKAAIIVQRGNIVVGGTGYILQGTGLDYTWGIYLEADNITIKNMKIKEFANGISLSSFNTISENVISANKWSGIQGYSFTLNNTISGNVITKNGEAGIRFWQHGDNNTILGNTITANNWTGITFLESTNNHITENEITDNKGDGIQIIYYSFKNTISGNTVTNNSNGIDPSAWENTVCENKIVCNDVGISIGHFDNFVYHNNFIANTIQVKYPRINTTWDNDYPSGGNYWDDHNPHDIYSGPNQDIPGSDGSGDTPYIVDGDNLDRYPLIYPHGYVPSPDINVDGIVGIFDLRICASAFGCKPGDMNWNPIVDLNIDGLIDIFGLRKIGKHYGEHL